MKERPILFSGPMVRALLDGSKTQTRRVVKPSPVADIRFCGGAYIPTNKHGGIAVEAPHIASVCPYGQPGDRLWVREAWRIGAWNESKGALAIDYMASAPEKTPWITVPEDPENYHGASVFEKYWIQSTDDCFKSKFEMDDNDSYHWAPGQSPCRIRPSIHMPRWVSRITLEITGVRVERLQDISEADAKAEGCTVWPECKEPAAINLYSLLWEKINGPDSWDANPWVWVIEFKKVPA